MTEKPSKTQAEALDRLRGTLSYAFIGEGGLFEQSGVVDGLMAIARSIDRLAGAIEKASARDDSAN